MINNLKNNSQIKINLFGKEQMVNVFSTGDNQFDEDGNYKDDDFELSLAEIEYLNWFIENIDISNYEDEIVEYCNSEYEMWSDTQISNDDILDEVRITAIAINITSDVNEEIPDIAFYGDCNCNEENGICIGFNNKKFIGVQGQDWIL